MPAASSPRKNARRYFSPLAAAEGEFQRLADSPCTPTVDGIMIGYGFPPREVPVRELKAVLMNPSCGFMARDAAWRFVVGAARNVGGIWPVVAVGLAMPALKRIAARVPNNVPGGRAEIEQEMLTGFLEELADYDLAESRVAARLCAAADRRMRRALYRACVRAGREVQLNSSAPLASPSGHPDFVLARAVERGVLTAREAEIIGRTRLEGELAERVAEEIGINRRWLFRVRLRAEQRLVQALADGDL